jgi:hypothetical protein
MKTKKIYFILLVILLATSILLNILQLNKKPKIIKETIVKKEKGYINSEPLGHCEITDSILKLRKKVLDEGCFDSYLILDNYYTNVEGTGELLPTAITMANKWGNYIAMYDVFSILYYSLNILDPETSLISSDREQFVQLIDPLTLDMAIEYLLASYYASDYEPFKERILEDDIKPFVKLGYIEVTDGEYVKT